MGVHFFGFLDPPAGMTNHPQLLEKYPASVAYPQMQPQADFFS